MSFQQGVTGLNSAGRNLDVIGNNVANASTVGAKSSRAEFSDIYARASGTGSVGIGVAVTTVSQQFGQGSISATSSSLDVAINGNGFFQLQDGNGMTQYSRNGQFQVDRDGFIVNARGLKLLGHEVTAAGGVQAGEVTPLKLPTVGSDPSQTKAVSLEVNLNSEASEIASTTAFDKTNSSTYNNTTSLTVYDQKGQSVAVSYFFRKSAKDTWDVYATANGHNVQADGSIDDTVYQPIASVTFAADGKQPASITTAAGTSTDNTPFSLPIGPTGSAGDALQTETLTGMTLDLSGMTQFGAAFGPTNLRQDGVPAGRLSAISISDSGAVVASYSNGKSADIGVVELANFRNPQGLQPLGGNTWAATFQSGDPIPGEPGSGNLGTLQSSSLEESNIDLTNELVNMMVAQRIYQANAQTIKTQDQVMQTLVNLR